ncbi:MAG: hypothetical protein ACREQF_13480, partial [Candidatus Binataceae bacterium]
RMLPMVESGALPFFHFDGQTIVIDDYLEVRPKAVSRIRALVQAGKLQIGPWYVLADSFLVSGESLIRNLEIGTRTAERYGPVLDVGYLPDQFGHCAQLPQILAGFGFNTAVLWRGVPRDIPRNRFIWEALDGSSVTTLYLPYGYSNGAWLPLDDPDALLAKLRDIVEREADFADGSPILVLQGTDHTEPDERLPERLREIRKAGGPSFEIGTLKGYLVRLSESPAEGIARHRGELRSPARAHLLPGVTSARTWIKQRDFANCYALERLADPLAALATFEGASDGHHAFLDLAWRLELQNQPHDSICGCSIDQVHEDMRYRFDQAGLIAEQVIRSASRELLAGKNDRDTRLAVFNATFSPTALVSGEADMPRPGARYWAIGPDGRRIATVVEELDTTRSDRCRLSFVADNLEQAGFTYFRLEGDDVGAPGALNAPSRVDAIANEFYRLSPSARGVAIEDRKSGRCIELYFEDDGDRGDEYNFDPVAGTSPVVQPATMAARVVEAGAVRSRMMINLTYELPDALTPDRRERASDTTELRIEVVATLFGGLDRVDLTARVTNQA